MVFCHLVPEDLGLLDGLFMQSLVVLSVDVGFRILLVEAACSLGYFAVQCEQPSISMSYCLLCFHHHPLNDMGEASLFAILLGHRGEGGG